MVETGELMTGFENLKERYFACFQLGLASNIVYSQAKQTNSNLHKFCEMLKGNSNYNEADKTAMKQELEILKGAFDGEIETYYQCG